MQILLALIVGVVAYFVAHLVFNEPISILIGVLAALSLLFGDSYVRDRRV